MLSINWLEAGMFYRFSCDVIFPHGILRVKNADRLDTIGKLKVRLASNRVVRVLIDNRK